MRTLFFICLLLTMPSHAAVTAGQGKIKSLMNAYGGWLLSVDSENNNPLNCSKATFLLEPSHSQYSELTTYIMAAYTTGKPVIFYLKECNTNGYSIVTNIYSAW